MWKMVENLKIMWKMVENYVENDRKLLLCGKWQKIIIMWKMVENYYYVENGRKFEIKNLLFYSYYFY